MWTGSDPFGPGTQNLFGWDQSSDPLQAAKTKADAAFESLFRKWVLIILFSDYDLIRRTTFAESEKKDYH
jgi:xylose isomerase